jgi:hypothetical protein
MLRPGLGFDFTGSPPHLTIMLKSVESLAAKAERAKRTTVEYLPLQEGASHHCAWCGVYAKRRPKGWQRYKALDTSLPGGGKVMGEVCGNPECRVSIETKYPQPE